MWGGGGVVKTIVFVRIKKQIHKYIKNKQELFEERVNCGISMGNIHNAFHLTTA